MPSNCVANSANRRRQISPRVAPGRLSGSAEPGHGDRPSRAGGLADAAAEHASAPLLPSRRKAGLAALRAYLAVAMILVIIKIASVALGH